MQELKEKYFSNQNNHNDTLNIREELEKFIIHWKWFVVSILLTLVLAFLYLRYTTPQFTASTSIMIKDNNKSGISSELAAFEDLGIIGGGSANNPDNEIQILKSRKIIGNVVDSLHLEISYFTEGRIKKSEIYENKPFVLKFLNRDLLTHLKDTSFVITILESGQIQFKDIEGNIGNTASLNEIVKSNIGHFQVVKLNELDNFIDEDITIN